MNALDVLRGGHKKTGWPVCKGQPRFSPKCVRCVCYCLELYENFYQDWYQVLVEEKFRRTFANFRKKVLFGARG
jgi:hypothetical protein